MLSNNNQRVTGRLARQSMKGNKGRYAAAAFAVFLSSFMLFSVLTAGVTYMKMKHVQDIRTSGGDMDAVVMGGFTEKQLKICRSSEIVQAAGASSYIGYVESTPWDATPNVGLLWADKTMWEEINAPAREEMKGIYPQAEDELLVTRKALESCGAGSLGIGDIITLTYAEGWRDGKDAGSRTKEFRICGIWEGYADQKNFYVSKAFVDKCKSPLEEMGQIFLKFTNFYISGEKQNNLEKSLELERRQAFLSTSTSEGTTEIILGLLGIVLVTVLSAWLLIYNILYLSVSGSTRYFGLLQTIGMTQRQVKQMLKKQMLFTGGAGLTGGLLLGAVISFWLIPAVVQSFGVRHIPVKPVFHPVIFLLTIFISAGTVYIGGRKPLKLMASITPIQALGCQKPDLVKIQKSRQSAKPDKKLKPVKTTKKSRKGRLLWRMAEEQLGKNKKRTAMVIFSVAVSLSVFLCMVTLIVSHGPRTVYSHYMNMDMTLINDTLRTEKEADWAQLVDADFIKQVRESEGIQAAHPILRQKIIVPWEPEFTDKWMREFCETWMAGVTYDEIVEEYKADPERYYSFIKGIDEEEFDYLNDTFDTPAEEQAFLRGETCIVYKNGLALNEEGFREEDLKGMELKAAFSEEPEEVFTFKIAGFTDDNYYGDMNSGTPIMIVSSKWLEETAQSLHQTEHLYVSKLNIQYNKEYDKHAEQAVLACMNESLHRKDFSYESKIENMENMKKAQGNMMGVGIGIVLILAFIGVMNYINTVFGSLTARQTSFSIMESVGMTEKQVRGLLFREGLLYAAGVIVVTGTAGLGVTYICYQKLNYMQIPFSIPVLPVVSAAAVMAVICAGVPLISYRLITKGRSLIERIRRFD